MKPKHLILPLISLLVLSVAFVQAQESRTLTIFAAASLADAFTEIGDAFVEQNPGVEILYNFAGSSTLAAQLAEGAPADVFASANHAQMDAAVESERISTDPQAFAYNRLLLIVPADNPAQIEALDDLAQPGVKFIIAAPEVPVRVYTDAMFDALAADSAYGEAFRSAVVTNIVSEEDNVRQVAAKVALGEADAGIVYSSDVTPDIAADVIALPIPAEVNTLAIYPIAVVEDSASPELARSFINFVLTDEGQDILVKWGFISVRDPHAEATTEPPATVEATARASS